MTVGCVVAFLFQPAINCFRSHVVQFGEKTVKDVIRVWNDKKDQVKTVVLEFLNLQMVHHHPGGVSDIKD